MMAARAAIRNVATNKKGLVFIAATALGVGQKTFAENHGKSRLGNSVYRLTQNQDLKPRYPERLA
jgi:hypothetical protein